MLSFANSRRLAYVANFTDLCPEMAPEGWNLYVGTAVPQPSVGDFDEDAETQILLDELRSRTSRDSTRRRPCRSTSPATAGRPSAPSPVSTCPTTTPIENLWNVGDGVKEYANGGTTACAETAQIVVERIKERFPIGATTTTA